MKAENPHYRFLTVLQQMRLFDLLLLVSILLLSTNIQLNQNPQFRVPVQQLISKQPSEHAQRITAHALFARVMG